MGPNQLFQRLVLLEQNDYWIGGQTWHGDLLSPLRIRHATTQPIRLLKTLHPRWSQNFRSDVLVSSSASHGNGRAVPSRAIGVKPGVASPLKFGLAIVDRELKSAGLLGNVEPTRSRSSLRVWRQLARLRPCAQRRSDRRSGKIRPRSPATRHPRGAELRRHRLGQRAVFARRPQARRPRAFVRLRRRLRSLHRALARAPPSRRSRLDNRAGLDPRPRLRAQARHLRRRLFLGGVASYRSDA